MTDEKTLRSISIDTLKLSARAQNVLHRAEKFIHPLRADVGLCQKRLLRNFSRMEEYTSEKIIIVSRIKYVIYLI